MQKNAHHPVAPQVFLMSLIWILVIALTAWTSQGWLQPDEHARVLEPAHFLAYGFASLPWEFNAENPIVSWFLGAIFAPTLMVTKTLGMDGMSEAATIRFITGLISSTRFIAIVSIIPMMGLKAERRLYYLAVMMVGLFGPLFLVRTSQENYAATALVWALFFALKIKQDGLTNQRAVGLGILLALATAARPQSGFAAAGLGLWVLYEQGVVVIAPALAGIVLGLTPLALVDWWTTGVPFLPAWNYAHYALSDEGGGQVWGTSPWWFYIREYFESWYPPLSIVLLLPLLVGVVRTPVLGAVVIPFALIHFTLGHKETRYFSPMIPFMQLAMFVGLEWMEKRSTFMVNILDAKKFWIRSLQFLAGLTLLAGLAPMNSAPWMYQELGSRVRQGAMTEFTYIGNSMSSFSQFYAKLPKPPQFKQIAWNDVVTGKERPIGWLVFYAMDPEDFEAVETLCQTKGVLQLSTSTLKFMLWFPRSPARKRVNAILRCEKPLNFTLASGA